jgi:hypothetical protein
VSGKQLKRALAVAGIEGLGAKLKAAPDSATMAEIFYEKMSGRLQEHTTTYWLDQFAAADVSATAVLRQTSICATLRSCTISSIAQSSHAVRVGYVGHGSLRCSTERPS